MIAIGDFVKVFLPSESPWAQVTAVRSDVRVEGRIHNELVNSKAHDLQRGDVLDFELSPVDIGNKVVWNWLPAPKVGALA